MSQVSVVLSLSRRLIEIQKRMNYVYANWCSYKNAKDTVNADAELETLKRMRTRMATILECIHVATDGADEDCLQNHYSHANCLKPYE